MKAPAAAFLILLAGASSVVPIPGDPDPILRGAGVETGWQAPRPVEGVGVVPEPTGEIGTALVGPPPVVAKATWYCLPGRSRCTRGWGSSCLCAAISPDLAGRFRVGSFVRVAYGSRVIRVRIVDCDCAARQGIDLYAAAFSGRDGLRVPLSRGQITVRLSR